MEEPCLGWLVTAKHETEAKFTERFFFKVRSSSVVKFCLKHFTLLAHKNLSLIKARVQFRRFRVEHCAQIYTNNPKQLNQALNYKIYN